ncbi:MAG: VOC family protein [Solibacillus sp.]
MSKMTPYLVFNGDTREAVELYAKAFNAKNVVISTFSELPPNPEHPIPKEATHLVMHASIELENSKMMFSDTFPGSPQVTTGDNITLAFTSDNEQEIRTIFELFAEGGRVTMPLQETFWSKCYGQITDKFGIAWQLSHEIE